MTDAPKSIYTGIDTTSRNEREAVTAVFTVEVIPADMDIWPFNRPQSENPIYGSKPSRKSPVLILGSATFDVTLIDFSSVRFGPTGTEAPISAAPQFQDGNYDGILDAVVQFTTGATGLAIGDSVAQVTGQLAGGLDFTAEDSVLVLP